MREIHYAKLLKDDKELLDIFEDIEYLSKCLESLKKDVNDYLDRKYNYKEGEKNVRK